MTGEIIAVVVVIVDYSKRFDFLNVTSNPKIAKVETDVLLFFFFDIKEMKKRLPEDLNKREI